MYFTKMRKKTSSQLFRLLLATVLTIQFSCSIEEIDKRVALPEETQIVKKSENVIGFKPVTIETEITSEHRKVDETFIINKSNIIVVISSANIPESRMFKVKLSSTPDKSIVYEEDLGNGQFELDIPLNEDGSYILEILDAHSLESFKIVKDTSIALDPDNSNFKLNFVDVHKGDVSLNLSLYRKGLEEIRCEFSSIDNDSFSEAFSLAKSQVEIQLPSRIHFEKSISLYCEDLAGNKAQIENISFEEEWIDTIDISISNLNKESKDGFLYEILGNLQLISPNGEVSPELLSHIQEELFIYFHYEPEINLDEPDATNIFWAQDYSKSFSFPFPSTLQPSVYMTLTKVSQQTKNTIIMARKEFILP